MTGWMFIKALHILAGTFWVGAAIMVTAFLLPAARMTGPAGGAFMTNLMQGRKLPLAINIASWAALFAGLILYWRFSNGFERIPMYWPGGISMLVGSMAGILAFLWGNFYQSPNAKRLSRLLGQLQGPPTPEQGARIQGLQKKLFLGGWFGVILLIICLIGMTMLH